MNFVINLTTNGTTERIKQGGRWYLVTEATTIVPGVLNGSKGALYYPKEQIAAAYKSWDGIPIVVYHPTRNGVNVSVKHPGILDESGVGFLRNSRLRRDGALQHKCWFDEDKVRRVDNRVYEALKQNRPIALSTGLFTDNIGESGTDPKGRPYDAIASNHRPDHLAILPDQVGACSLNDGCGINVNTLTVNEWSDAAREAAAAARKAGGYTASDKAAASSETAGKQDNYDNHARASNDHYAASQAHAKAGNAEAAAAHREASSAHHAESQKFLDDKGYIKNTWNKLVHLLYNAFERDDGGRFTDAKVAADEKAGIDDEAFLRPGKGQAANKPAANEDDTGAAPMKSSGKVAKARPAAAVGSAEAASRVNNADQPRHPRDGKFQGKTHLAAKRGMESCAVCGNSPCTCDDSTTCNSCGCLECTCMIANTWSDAAREASLAARKASMKADNARKDERGASASDTPGRLSVVAHLKSKSASSAKQHNDAAEAHLEAAAKYTAGASGHRYSLGTRNLMRDAAAAHSKAAEVHHDVSDHTTNSELAMNREELIDFVTNCSDDELATLNSHPLAGVDREQQKAAFAHMDKDETSSDTKDAKAASATAAKSGTKSAHQKAASAHREAAESHKAAGNDEMAKAHRDMARSHSQSARMATNADEDDGDDDADADDDDDMNGRSPNSTRDKNKKGPTKNAAQWLASAPPEIRSVVSNAMRVEQSARQLLVNQLTANLKGLQKKQVFNRIQNYSLEELQDLALMTGVRNTESFAPLPVFLGANAPMVGNTGHGGQPCDDILPLPTDNMCDEEFKKTKTA